MLRLLVLFFAFANLAVYAWTQGLLLPWGLGPTVQAEPQRLGQQIRPDAIQVLPRTEVASGALPAATRPAECWQTGPLNDEQAGYARQVLESWPAGSWSLEAMVEPGRWIVYMGKYPNSESLERKKIELRQLGLAWSVPTDASLLPGLALGSADNPAGAQRQLEALLRRGVRTARVVEERAEQRGWRLVLPGVDESLRQRVEAIRLAIGGRPMGSCHSDS